MSIMRRLLIPTALLAGLVYWLCSPVPDGYSVKSSWKIRQMNAGMKVFGLVIYIRGYFQTINYIDMFRVMHPSSDDDVTGLQSDVQVEKTVFDNVPVIIYRPTNGQTADLPGFVFYHGGGWTFESAARYHPLVLLLCQKTNAVFVSVDYRLAPEHPFPAGFEDSLAATKFFITHSEEYGVDPFRIAIGGDSAGGNLAAAIALKLREEEFQPSVKMQVLIYPALQLVDFQLPSMLTNSQEFPLSSRDLMAYIATAYLNGSTNQYKAFSTNSQVSPATRKQLSATHLDVDRLPKKYLIGYTRPTVHSEDERFWEEMKERMLNQYVSPLIAEDLSDLPMSYVFTCEYDSLRDDGFLYVHRLKEAGNDVTHVNSEIGLHGILSFGRTWPEGDAIIDGITEYIVRNL